MESSISPKNDSKYKQQDSSDEEIDIIKAGKVHHERSNSGN